MTTRVVLDATPLLGQPTGVGVFTEGLFSSLSGRPEIDLAAYALSFRGFDRLAESLPVGVDYPRLPMPADVLMKSWARTNHPTVDRWVGAHDVVHGTNFVVPPSRSAMLASVHDLTAVHFPEMCSETSLRYPQLVRKAVERGAHVHVLSATIGREVSEVLDVNPGRIHLIPPGIPKLVDGEAASAQRGRELSGYDRYIVAIGTIEPRKDYVSLLRAFDSIAGAMPDVGLVIIGAFGWGSEVFQEALLRLRHHDRVHTVGYVDDQERAALLRGASVLAYPSVYEGFGLPPLEAMSAGVPVVATNGGAIPEVVDDAAYLVEVGDDEALASALVEVMDDPALRRELITLGAQRARAYDWNRTATEFVQLYEQLAKERSA
jgi:glycosyltransferase involved in cell wall biosynthesis